MCTGFVMKTNFSPLKEENKRKLMGPKNAYALHMKTKKEKKKKKYFYGNSNGLNSSYISYFCVK